MKHLRLLLYRALHPMKTWRQQREQRRVDEAIRAMENRREHFDFGAVGHHDQ